MSDFLLCNHLCNHRALCRLIIVLVLGRLRSRGNNLFSLVLSRKRGKCINSHMLASRFHGNEHEQPTITLVLCERAKAHFRFPLRRSSVGAHAKRATYCGRRSPPELVSPGTIGTNSSGGSSSSSLSMMIESLFHCHRHHASRNRSLPLSLSLSVSGRAETRRF